MSHVGFYRFGSPSLELAVIVLAAVGLDELGRVGGLPRRLLWAGAAALVLVALAAIGSRSLIGQLEPRFHHRPYFWIAVGWGALVVVVGCALVFLRAARTRIVLLSALVAVDALALFVAPELSAPRAVTIDRAPVAFLQQHLGLQRFFTLGPLQPNYGAYWGVASLNVNDVPVPSSFVGYVHRRLDPVVNPWVFNGSYGGGRPPSAPSPLAELLANVAGYRAAGVSFVLAPPRLTVPFKPVFRSATTSIYRLPGAAPYFSADGCAVSASTRTAATVSCRAPTLLVRRETDLPGWSAAVDGRTVRVGRVDGLFQAVAVPAGSHRVRFSYSPPGLAWGACAFIVGLAWLVWPLRRRGALRSRSRG